MTTGHSAATPQSRWTRERLLGLGLVPEQILVVEPPPRGGFTPEVDLAPASYAPEFAPLVERVQRLLAGPRAASVYVAGGRDEARARIHAALQIALGLAPHGHGVVVADTDFLRAGLGGLVTDPLADGVLDMVRFGRSTRSILQRPVPEGPWLLPAGSIPAEDASPLDADALRSVVYRVSQTCALALYVGPVRTQSAIHPMVHACDHVLLAGDDDEPGRSQELVDVLAELQRSSVHVLGVVLWAKPRPQPSAPETWSAPLAIPMPTPAPAPLPAEPARGFEAATPPWPHLPEPEPSLPRFEPPPAVPEPRRPEIGLPPLEPLPAMESALPEPEPEPEPLPLPPRAAHEPPPLRSTEESRRVRAEIGLPDAEFAFDDDAKSSRWPVVVVVILLLAIAGLLGGVIWMRTHETGGGLPPVEVAKPDDAGASGGQTPQSTPPSTSVPPAGTIDDRAASGGGAPSAPKPAPAPVEEPQGSTPVEPPPQSPGGSPGASEAGGKAGPTTGNVEPPKPAPAPQVEPPKPAPPVETPPPAVAGGTLYAVHVASYRTTAKANVEIANLEKLGYTARAVRTDLGDKGIWYRVYVGSYPSVAAANVARDALLKNPDYTFAQVRRLPRD